MLQSIIRNSFGYIAISIVLNRKTSFYVIAEKWLKRNYIMNGREREGKKRGEIEKAACSAGAGSVLSAGVSGKYRRAGGGANASGAGACCERLCGTFSVM